jgi:DNA-binding protein H-NS
VSEQISSIDQQIANLLAQKNALLESNRAEALRQAKESIALYGFTASELGLRTKANGAAAESRPKAAPKYANPHNSSQTWAGGKGARPNWVKSHIANGGKVEDLLINR